MSINAGKKEFIKLLGINFSILIILLSFPALFYRFYTTIKNTINGTLNQTLDQRAFYPTYENKKFAIDVLNESSKTTTNYKSFIGWRRGKVNLKYTNILGPYNTRKSQGEEIDNSVWFFGGSTMWGTGASDSQTIPSHFHSLTSMPVYNFGESGWNSRQSLNQLINTIGDSYKPSKVIFFDGVNDVAGQCRREFKLLPIHNREVIVQTALKQNKIQSYLKFIISPYIAIAKKFNVKLSINNYGNLNEFDCNTNKVKARLIARHLVNNWRTAYLLSKYNGIEFYGILQPTIYTTTTNSEYFTSADRRFYQLESQYNTVYPLILQEIKRQCKSDQEFCSSMINGKDWLDGTNNIFIDFCHVNSLGNEIIAKRIKSLLKNEN